MVFREVVRLNDFADVVIVSASANEEVVSVDGHSGGFGEFSDVEAMLVASGRLFFEALEERVLDAG